MENKTIGWEMYETIGQAVINPIIYVHEIIRKNKETTTEDNIGILIKKCFEWVPHRKEKIINIISDAFPDEKFQKKINTFKILI